jgi:uncharacterized phage protein (TIGR02218 family)
MTYDATEISASLGRPVDIFTFARGPQEWRYTSADRDVTVSAQVYTAVPIIRPSISQGGELNRSGLKLTVARDFPIAVLFRAGIPSETITLRIRQYHDGDGSVVVVWSGRVVNVSRVGELAEITCEPIYTSVRSTGLRRRYQKGCPHVLYGPACKVVAASFDLAGTVSAVSGLTVTATAFGTQPDGYWEGGYIEWSPSAGIFERRFIDGHTGTSVTLMTQPLGLAVSTAITIYPGCDHTLGAGGCTKFSNTLNYGGTPDIPEKNPYGSDPIY